MDIEYALSIVVPVYNGASTVGELVAELAQLDVPGGHEIVLVVDGSPDNSLAVCRDLMATTPLPIMVVDLMRNFGEHNAVMAGLRQARGRHVITMDDDLQNPPSEVLRILDFAQQTGADAVYTYYEEKQHAWWRNLGSRFTNWCADHLLDKPKGLYLSSFRCLHHAVVEQVIKYQGPFPYVDGLVMQTTSHIHRIAVHHLPRAEGRSNYTWKRLLRLWLNMFCNFSVVPLRISTIVGMLFAGLGMLGAIEVVAEAVFMGHTPQGWGSVMAAVLILSGVQLMILGVVGEYLGSLYLTVNGKPQSVVRTIEQKKVPGGKVATLRSTGAPSKEPAAG